MLQFCAVMLPDPLTDTPVPELPNAHTHPAFTAGPATALDATVIESNRNRLDKKCRGRLGCTMASAYPGRAVNGPFAGGGLIVT